MNYSREDYLVAVLQGKCNRTLPNGPTMVTKTISYEEWVNSQRMKQDLRDRLADMLRELRE